MTFRPLARGIALAALAFFPLVDHVVLVAGRWPHLLVGLTVAQVMVLTTLLPIRSAPKYKWIAAAAVGLLFAGLWWHSARLSFVAASGIPYAVIYSLLLAAFAATLLPGREALITKLARKLRGPLPPEIVAYTRAVTWAWCLFFAAQLLCSFALLTWAPIRVWSFFVNMLNLPLILLMFVAEYAFRLAFLRDPPRYKLSDFAPMVAYIRASFSNRAVPN